MNNTTTVTEEHDNIFLRQKHSPRRRKIWIPFLRGKWKVMAGNAELCIRDVTREFLLSKGTFSWKESNGHCNITCNLGSVL